MAESTLRTDLDQIATALEKKGRTDLAGIVDLCNHQIHQRQAAVSVSKPARVAATGDRAKKVRWAAAELRSIARDLRKEGNVKDAMQFIRMANELMEDESVVEGPVVEGEEPIEAVDAIDIDDEGDEGDESDDDECPPCPPCEPAHDDAAVPVELTTVEACAKELRRVARELRASTNPKDRATARALLRQAMELEVDPALGTQPAELPPSDGGSDPVDATDFDLSDVPLPELDAEGAGEGDIEDIISDEILDLEAAPETTPTEYVEAALSLARAAATLERAGEHQKAAKLVARAKEFRAKAITASRTARTAPKAKLSPKDAAKRRFLASLRTKRS